MKDVRWSHLYFTLDTKRKALAFSRIYWQVWFHPREPRDCRERILRCPSRCHNPRRSLECPAFSHGNSLFCRHFEIPLIAIIFRALASSLRSLYATSRTLTRSNLSVITQTISSLGLWSGPYTHLIEKKWAYVRYASMHCRTCGIGAIQSSPYNKEVCLLRQSSRIFAVLCPWKQRAL